MKPSSLQEAISVIMAMLPSEEREVWATRPKDKAITSAHFGLGMWIRNQWVYGGSPLVTEIYSLAGGITEDDISSLITEAVWHVLNGAPCPELQDLLSKFPSYPPLQSLTWE